MYPKLSIITVNLNNAAGLHKTIESVVEQSFSDYEYIIIDGASIDGSVELLRQFADKLKYWVSESDEGIYNAMNKGIKMASGIYCLFLNSGDYLFNSEILCNVFLTTPTEDIVFGDILYESSKNKVVIPDNVDLETFLNDSIAHGASFIKRELFSKIGLYNEQNEIVSDWEFFMEAFVKFKCSYRHINKVITVYQSGGISMNEQFFSTQLTERKEAYKKLFPEIYNIIIQNLNFKNELKYYKSSRTIQVFKKIQHSYCYRIKSKLVAIRKKLKSFFILLHFFKNQ